MKFGKAFIVPFILFGLVILIILISFISILFGVSGEDAGAGAMLIAMAVGVGGAFYLMPAFIAGIRDAPNYSMILLINILAGWTVLGWIAMVIWAIVDKAERPVVVHQIIHHEYPRQSEPPPLP